jgi:hypothetical protein
MISATLLSLVVSLGLVNDDRDVIQTALLSFFTPEEWHSADWKPKFKVVLRTQFRSKDRPNFRETMNSLEQELRSDVNSLVEYIAKRQHDAQETKRLGNLLEDTRIQLNAVESLNQRNYAETYRPPDLHPVKSMEWDKRILLSDETNRPRFWNKKNNPKIEDRTVEARTTRPTYSPDGSIAIVEFGIPWSIHSADVTFVFERTANGWTRRAVVFKFYV